MKMRWVLRYKESGKPRGTFGNHWLSRPRVGSDVRTEAPVASRRGRSLFFIAQVKKSSPIEKVDRQERVSKKYIR